MEIHIVWGLNTTPEKDQPEGGEGQEGSSGADPSSEMHSEIPPSLTGLMLSTEGLQEEEVAPPSRCSLMMEICWRTCLLAFEWRPLLAVLLIDYANKGRDIQSRFSRYL